MKSSEMEYKAEWKKYKENPVTSQIPTLFHIIGGYVVINFFSKSFRENIRRIACADKSCMNDLFVTTMEN